MKYSVIIPTRDRFIYLSSAIQSCLVTARDDLEVVVSINTSKRWSEILDEYEPIIDPRVRYVLTGRLLSMNQNFNFGILQARGQYITTLGDDDAMLPSAFAYADQFFDQHPDLPLCWFRRPYFWPDYQQQPFSNLVPDTLHCWTSINLQLVESRPILEAICTQYVPYHNLPSIYNSFYPSQLVMSFLNAQQKIEGSDVPRSIFLKEACSLDVFTAYACLLFVEKYALISLPLSLSGISVRSNGMAFAQKNIGEEAKRYLQEISPHLSGHIRSGPFSLYNIFHVQIFNESMKVLNAYGDYCGLGLPSPNYSLIASSLIDTYCQAEYLSSPWAVVEVLRLAIDYDVKSHVEKLTQILLWYTNIYDDELRAWWTLQKEPDQVSMLNENYHVLNCKQFGVLNAFHAASLYERYLLSIGQAAQSA